MDAEEIYESVCEQIREDTFIPLTADLAPEVGTLLAELRGEVDEERRTRIVVAPTSNKKMVME